MMARNTSVKSLDKVVAFIMTKTDLFMMENGLMIRSQAKGKCSTQMVQSMMDNGLLTKFMEKVSSSQATGIGMKATLTSAFVKALDLCSTEMETLTKDSGRTTNYADKECFTSKMETITTAHLSMATLKDRVLCSSLE
jgi:hypothetical protein